MHLLLAGLSFMLQSAMSFIRAMCAVTSEVSLVLRLQDIFTDLFLELLINKCADAIVLQLSFDPTVSSTQRK